MKCLKMWSVATAVAAALMAFAGSASATTLTDGSGGHPTLVKATSSHANLHNGFINMTCTWSYFEGSPNTGGSGVAVTGAIGFLEFTNCGSWNVTIIKPGSFGVHALLSNNGIFTSTGAEITIEGFGLHCIFGTNNNEIGTITGSANTKGHAILDVAASIPRTGGRSGAFCGSTINWTGSSYTLTSPAVLNVDP